MLPALLPQEPAPVTQRDAARAARFLFCNMAVLEDLFLALRLETDQVLSQKAYSKPYPLGRCREITLDVITRLKPRLMRLDHPGLEALAAFLADGGTGRCVWGVLRDRYFQTALQFGGLYVDVSNDTVTVSKPKVEILPMAQAGLEAVRGPEHFAAIAGAYWGTQIVANHALPSLAPILPMIGLAAGSPPELLSATHYMVGLFRRDRFVQAETWLRQGPTPAPEVIQAVRAYCPADLLAASSEPSIEAALAACRDARAKDVASELEWCAARVAEYQRIRVGAPHRAFERNLSPSR